MQAVIWGVWLGSLGLLASPWPTLSSALVMAVLTPVIAIGLTIIIHEAGHALTGKALGFDLFAVGVWPGQARKTWRGWQVGWWDIAEANVGGFVVQSSRHVHHLRWRLLAVYLGGPAANLVAALGVSVGLTLAPPALPVWVQVWAVLVSWVNVEAALSNLWLAARRPRSDGWAVRALLLQQNELARRELLAWRLVMHWSMVRGQRPRDWPLAVLRDLVTPHAHPFGYAQFLYRHALDSGRIGRALVWLERCGPAGWALAERAYVLARYTPHRVTAHQLLQHSRQKHPRAEAALALAEGHVAEARARIQAALYDRDDDYDPGLCRAEWHALRTLRHHRPPAEAVPPLPAPPIGRLWQWRPWLSNSLLVVLAALVLGFTATATATLIHWPDMAPPCQRAPLADAWCKLTARWQMLAALALPPAERVAHLEAVLAGYPQMTEAHVLLALNAPAERALKAAHQVMRLARTPEETELSFWLYATTTQKHADPASAWAAWTLAAQAAQSPATRAEAYHHLAALAQSPQAAVYHAERAFAEQPHNAAYACDLAQRYAAVGERFQAVRHAQISGRLGVLCAFTP